MPKLWERAIFGGKLGELTEDGKSSVVVLADRLYPTGVDLGTADTPNRREGIGGRSWVTGMMDQRSFARGSEMVYGMSVQNWICCGVVLVGGGEEKGQGLMFRFAESPGCSLALPTVGKAPPDQARGFTENLCPRPHRSRVV